MDNIEKAVTNNFAKWRIEKRRNESSEEEVSQDMADYMNEAFQINNTESWRQSTFLTFSSNLLAPSGALIAIPT